MNQMLRLALGATVIAAGCGGGDPPGGGNGDTGDGGGTTDGEHSGTDGPHVPNPNNPLIAVIPGTWELIAIDIDGDDQGWVEFSPGDPNRISGPATVDPNEPGCDGVFGQSQPPGDACILWGQAEAYRFQPPYLVLDGETVRIDMVGERHYEGQVLDSGRLIEYSRTWCSTNCLWSPSCQDWDEEREVCRDPMWTFRYRKID